MTAGGLAACLAGATPRGQIAAVFPPWWDAARGVAAAAAGGAVIRRGALPFVILVAADSAGARRLRQGGAWLLIPAGMFGGCAARGAGAR